MRLKEEDGIKIIRKYDALYDGFHDALFVFKINRKNLDATLVDQEGNVLFSIDHSTFIAKEFLDQLCDANMIFKEYYDLIMDDEVVSFDTKKEREEFKKQLFQDEFFEEEEFSEEEEAYYEENGYNDFGKQSGKKI